MNNETKNVVDEASRQQISDKDRLQGIMYTESGFEVSFWMKLVFFFFSLALLGAVIAYAADKRMTMEKLAIDSVVEATPMKAIPAPIFELEEPYKTKKQALLDLKGKWVFINFWATWCPPCRDEMMSLEMLYRRMEQDYPGKFAMLAISVDEDWNEVNRFFGEIKPQFQVLWDKNKKVATELYATRKFPESYLIDPQGNVVAKYVGPRDWYNRGTVQYFSKIIEGKLKPGIQEDK